MLSLQYSTLKVLNYLLAFLVAQMVKNLPAMWETQAWIPGSRRSPGEGNGYPFQYSCLENSTDRGAWWATVHGVAKSRTRLSLLLFQDTHFGFLGGSDLKESACNTGGSELDSWVGKIPQRREWLPTPGESHGQRSLAGTTIQGITKSWA